MREGGKARPSQSMQTGTGTDALGWGDPDDGKLIEHAASPQPPNKD